MYTYLYGDILIGWIYSNNAKENLYENLRRFQKAKKKKATN